MNRLGYSIKRLCDLRGLTQSQLGKQVGISEVALSHIVNGQTKPRPITLTKLIHALCLTHDEYQNLIACYEGGADKLKEVPEFLEWKPNAQEELERARRYLAVKAASMCFQNEVEQVIQSTGRAYERDVIEGDSVADFVVGSSAGNIVVECKYNVNRDWDRTVATVRLLKQALNCLQVVVAVPILNDLATAADKELRAAGDGVTSLEQLAGVMI